MTLGIDYYNTITKDPTFFTSLAWAMKLQNNDVYVVSAIGNKISPEQIDAIKNCGVVERKNVHVILVNGVARNAPQAKLEKCKELGITHFFDDRQDVVDLLNENGILAFKVPKERRRAS